MQLQEIGHLPALVKESGRSLDLEYSIPLVECIATTTRAAATTTAAPTTASALGTSSVPYLAGPARHLSDMGT